jgi:hypothetical protein
MWFQIQYLEINMQQYQSSHYTQWRGTEPHSDHVIEHHYHQVASCVVLIPKRCSKKIDVSDRVVPETLLNSCLDTIEQREC